MYCALNKNQISFDLMEKFNQKQIELFSTFPLLSINLNEKQIEKESMLSVPLLYINLYSLNVCPHYVRLRHAVSNFKTRGGEQHGSKSVAKKTAAYDFLMESLYAFFYEMTGIDSTVKIGVSNKNNFSVGFGDVKKVTKFSQLDLEYFNNFFGLTLSFAIKKSRFKMKGEYFMLFMSTFVYQTYQ